MKKRTNKLKIQTLLYTAYAVLIFLILCLIYVPIMMLLCQKKRWHRFALRLHTVWAWSIFTFIFIRVKVEWRFRPDPNTQYIYCANHFSYLDIPTIFLLFHPRFIGKSSLASIPLFGYFYSKIHIPVDRSSLKSRAESLRQTREVLEEGFEVAFFPEGGVKVLEENIPRMVAFRNGAFVLSAEKNIPIIPVTIPFNYRIVPGKSPLRFHWHHCKLVVHEPVVPLENTDAEVERLKNKVFDTIQDELNAHHPDKVPSVE